MGRLIDPVDARRAPDDAGEHGFRRFIAAIEGFPKPIVAAVNGVAVGIGTTMLPYCDLVLVSRDRHASGCPFATLGVVPEAGSTFTLPAVMGWQAAAHAFFTGEWFDADGAVASRPGVEDACPPDTLARRGDRASPARSRACRSCRSWRRSACCWRHGSMPARPARAREEEVFGRLTGAPANREAIAASWRSGAGLHEPARGVVSERTGPDRERGDA